MQSGEWSRQLGERLQMLSRGDSQEVSKSTAIWQGGPRGGCLEEGDGEGGEGER